MKNLFSLALISFLLTGSNSAFAQEMGKTTMEMPVESLLKTSNPREAVAKNGLEIFVEGLWRATTGTIPTPKQPTTMPGSSSYIPPMPRRAPVSATSDDRTPDRQVRVRPGYVNWHDSFELAIASAKATQKPVLLFQMMGKLDQKFC